MVELVYGKITYANFVIIVAPALSTNGQFEAGAGQVIF
jgi:hypothetical protein